VIDCTHARLLWVWQRREAQELDAGEAQALERHFGQCAGCVSWTQQESQTDAALAAALRDVPVPAQLSQRIHKRLGRERRLQRLPWVAAAAAVLLLAVGIGGYLLTRPAVVEIADVQADGGYISIASADTAAQWYASQGVDAPMPSGFNFDQLNSCGFATIRGRRVPRLEFFHGGDAQAPAAVAHVLIVDETQFNVEEIVASAPSPVPLGRGRHTVEVLREVPGFVFIAVYTGGSLQRFLSGDAFQ
jgi:hypothetical protein